MRFEYGAQSLNLAFAPRAAGVRLRTFIGTRVTSDALDAVRDLQRSPSTARGTAELVVVASREPRSCASDVVLERERLYVPRVDGHITS